VLIILHEEQKKKFAFIFQLPGWALVAPLCFALQAFLLSKVSWRGWHYAELALFMLALLRAPSKNLVIKVQRVHFK